jgi:serine/threonine-protein kinase
MKVLLPDLQGQEEVAARFLREIKLLAALSHPNIAALHTALTIDNQLVMLMEFVEGKTLASLLTYGPIPVSNALNYMDQVLSALSYAHQHHVIHRDIKPANMMITHDNTLKLMDFGIARVESEPANLTQTGTTLGSINYMSPEQVRGAAVDERSDIYSLGISLYEMVTGEKPFQGDSNFSIMSAHLQQNPRPPMDLRPELPAGLNEVILTAIAKLPAERFQSADAFRNALSNVRGSAQSTATGLTTLPPSGVAAPQSTAARAAANAPTWMSAGAAAAPAAAISASPLPPITPAPGQGTGHRGLYMALGGLVVVAVLVAAGIYIPGRGKAANPDANPSVTLPVQQQAAAPKAQASPVRSESTSSDPSATAMPTSVPEPPPSQATSQPSQQVPASALKAASKLPKQFSPRRGNEEESTRAASDSAAASNNAQILDDVEHEIDQLYSRAGAVNSSLDHMQQQQASAGYGLRSDIAERQASLKVNLAKAQNAIEHNDAARAKRYADMTAADLEVLEKFLGR